MSFNVRFQAHDNLVCGDGRRHPWDERKDRVFDAVVRSAPDVVGFQEVQDKQRDYLLERLAGYDSHTSGSVGDALDQTFLIVWNAARFGRLAAGSTPIPGPEPHNRRAMAWVRLGCRAGGDDIFVFNTHFPPGRTEPEKLDLCRLVADFINRTAEEDSAVVLTGDLNVRDDNSDGIDVLRRRAGLIDPWTDTVTAPAYTWRGWGGEPQSRSTVDWILYRRPLRAVRVERPMPGPNEDAPSDHPPVHAMLASDREPRAGVRRVGTHK